MHTVIALETNIVLISIDMLGLNFKRFTIYRIDVDFVCKVRVYS